MATSFDTYVMLGFVCNGWECGLDVVGSRESWTVMRLYNPSSLIKSLVRLDFDGTVFSNGFCLQWSEYA